MPTVPPAPGRLSITICCPSRALSSVATIRLVTSGPLPGPQGTTHRMGFVGYCAHAEVDAKPSRTAIRASASKNLRICPSVLTNHFNVRYGLRIQPVSATFYALAREEDVANGIQTEDLLYGSSEGVDVGSLANRRFIGNHSPR